MKPFLLNIIKGKLIYILILVSITNFLWADGSLVAYYRVAEKEGSIEDIAKEVESALKSRDYTIKGTYHPGKKQSRYVIAFTRNDLLDIAFEAGGRNSLACMLKVGLLKQDNGKVEISLLNPFYIFYSYLRDDVNKYEEQLNKIQTDAITALSQVGTVFDPFGGGSLSEAELKDFRYLSHMPGFDEPVKLNEFTSFRQGVNKVKNNLRAQREGTYNVYEVINNQKNIAIFGVGLRDERLGEDKFLPILGEDHLASLPYELIIVNKEAYMLNGRYRFPLFWADLSMVEYRKINRTTRDIRYMMKRITK